MNIDVYDHLYGGYRFAVGTWTWKPNIPYKCEKSYFIDFSLYFGWISLSICSQRPCVLTLITKIWFTFFWTWDRHQWGWFLDIAYGRDCFSINYIMIAESMNSEFYYWDFLFYFFFCFSLHFAFLWFDGIWLVFDYDLLVAQFIIAKTLNGAEKRNDTHKVKSIITTDCSNHKHHHCQCVA